jgi:CheY-like chemotaxis protein
MVDKDKVEICLVEDEPTLQYLFQRQLKRLGYKAAAVADNGLSAVEKVLEHPYDIVFMDVRLPGIDGITATERIRELENKNGGRTIIIGMTAFTEQKRCLDAGMDDFLQKPVLLEQLDETIEKWLTATVLKETAKVPTVDMDRFSQTNTRLRDIQDKIAKLRLRVGMEKDSPK